MNIIFHAFRKNQFSKLSKIFIRLPWSSIKAIDSLRSESIANFIRYRDYEISDETTITNGFYSSVNYTCYTANGG